MTRLGLYLCFPPHGGGTFQYARSILAACKALPGDRFELVVAYSDPAWIAILRDATDPSPPSIHVLQVQPCLRDRVGFFLLRNGLVSVEFLRRHALRCFPFIGKLHALRCDGWLFPAQEHFAFLYPGTTIAAIHDLMHRYEPGFPEVSGRGMHRRRETLLRNLSRYVSGILVDSELGQRHVLESYPKRDGKVHVLPYVAAEHIFEGRQRLESDLPERYVVYPAQFWMHKNHVRLVQAFKQVVASATSLHLVLVGSPNNGFDAMMDEVRRLGLEGRVHVLGYVADECMRDLYLRSEGLVMPTFFGPTNIPPLEAMALGIPMALSDRYAMQQQAGEAALYFDPGSVEQMASAILRMVTDQEYRDRSRTIGLERTRLWGQAQFNARLASILGDLFPLPGGDNADAR